MRLDPEPETGSSVHGTTQYYSFSLPADQNNTYTTLRIDWGAASPTSFSLQNDIFVVPSQTTINGTKVDITVAIRPGQASSPADVVVTAPVRQQGTLAPKITEHDVELAETGTTGSGGYQLWTGSADLGTTITSVTGAVGVSIDVAGEGGTVRDVLYLSAGVAAW